MSKVFYSRGTMGDAFVILCKIYGVAVVEYIELHHYTIHKHILKNIRQVYNLLPRINLTFDTYPRSNAMRGDFTEMTEYTQFFPTFQPISIDHLEIGNDYIVLQTHAGINSSRSCPTGRIDAITEHYNKVVLVGWDGGKPIERSSVVDLRNKLDLLEVVHVLRQAKRFYGLQGLLAFIALSQKTQSFLWIDSPEDKHAISVRILNSPWARFYEPWTISDREW